MKRNRSTKAILEAYDAQQSYTVVSFKNGRRTLTYGHLDPLAAIKYVQECNLKGLETLVFKESWISGAESSWDKEHYLEILKRKNEEDLTNAWPKAKV